MQLFALLASLLYLGLGIFLIRAILSPEGPKPKPVYLVAGAAILLHLAALGQDIMVEEGQNVSLLNMASLVGLLISAILTASVRTLRMWIVLPGVYVFTALSLIAAELVPTVKISHFEDSPELVLHISLSLLAYSMLMIAMLYALMLGYLNRQLKTKQLHLLPAMPPLLTAERQLFRLLLLSLILLTCSLLSGFIFVGDIFADGKAHKAVFSILTWLVLAVLLWGHYRQGWRGHRAINMTLISAVLLTLAYFGSRFVQEIILG